MGGDLLAGIGDLVFSVVVGYVGAIEFLYVVRHLYHWSCRHAESNEYDEDSLKALQDHMRQKLNAAEAKEALANADIGVDGVKAMQDGVLYKDGFRIESLPQQDIDNLIAKDQRRKEIEIELAKQKEIEAATRKQLEAAEAELLRQREAAEATAIAEAAEMEHQKLVAAEKAREEQQRLLELEAQEREAENERKLKEEEEEAEAAEMSQNLLAAERAQEELERQRELAEEADARARVEQLIEEQLLYAEAVAEEEKQRKLIEAERKQKLIEENARKFLEAELEMAELHKQMTEAAFERQQSTTLDSVPQTPIPVEEAPCIRKTMPVLTGTDSETMPQTVKTQFGQTSREPYSLTSKSLLFSEISDEGSSIEPESSQQSSFCTQASDDTTTGTGTDNVANAFEMRFSPLERQEPDGEDNMPVTQYSDDYLRSLDGIKQKPLVREDGSGRRRAFKKRRSSGSSTSSRDSRMSREEEVKMFTSLEEEELQTADQGDSSDYAPIKYTSEPTLKVKGHQRRHKRSPAKDLKTNDESMRSSLEMLGEENSNPWGEVVPEHYKNTDFWKREKAISIDEEEMELEKPATEKETDDNTATNLPNTSAFKEATHTENEEAITTLQKQLSKEYEETDAWAEPIKNANIRGDNNTKTCS